jgi:phage terminase large subunit-like protein
VARVQLNPNDPHCFVDQDEVDRWCAFLTRHIKLVEAEWKGKQMTLADYVIDDFITPLVGWKNKETLKRQFHTAFITWARKNRKTTTTAAFAIGMTAIDGEESAENYVVAKTEKQARKLFGTAVKMIRSSETLNYMFKIREAEGEIEHLDSESVFRVVASEASTNLGGSPHFVIIDEWQEQQTNDLRLAFDTGTGARSQPLLVMIGTAGVDKSSAGGREYEYAQSVLKGEIEDDEYYACIYEADFQLDPFSEEAIKQANPGYPEAPKEREIKKLIRRAKTDPEFMCAYRRYHLNQYVEDADSPIKDFMWNPCAIALEGVTFKDFIGCPLYIGIDLASTDDLTAVVYLFIKDGMPWCFPFFFIPEKTVNDKWEAGQRRYKQWVQQGVLIQTPGNECDYDFIAKMVKTHADELEMPIKAILYDPHKSHYVAQALKGDGFELVAIRQSFGLMSPPTVETIRRIKRHEMRHNDHPIMNWCIRNARIITNSEADIKFDKTNAQEKKIDGAVALALAMRGAMAELANPGDDISKHFEEHGVDVA